jgi:hypothetical protein
MKFITLLAIVSGALALAVTDAPTATTLDQISNPTTVRTTNYTGSPSTIQQH